MSVAIITADVGGIDNTQKYCAQDINAKMHRFNEHNLPWPMPNLNDRLKAKYIKIMMHRAVPGFENYIWIDGRISIVSSQFAEAFTVPEGYDMVICRHPERKTVYEEMEFIMDMMKSGNSYLLSRYSNQQMEKEYAFYKEEGLPKDFPLYACGLFGRICNPIVNNFMNEWWLRTLEFSYFDQTMFSYVAWKQRSLIYAMEPTAIIGPLLKIDKHR